MTTTRRELLDKCKELNLKNIHGLKKCELQDLLDMVREGKELPERFTGERRKRPRKLVLYDEVYGSISKASIAIGVSPMQIYKLLADGCGKFLR